MTQISQDILSHESSHHETMQNLKAQHHLTEIKII